MNRETSAMLVGLCGRSGAGKGYVSKLFAKEGIPSIDTDLVYRTLTGPCTEENESDCMRELVQYFGFSIRNVDGSLNRAVLRTMVFGAENKARLHRLNEITHRHILKKTSGMAEELCEKGFDIVLIDAPLLFESGFNRFCAAVVCVTAPEELLIERIIKRDGLDRSSAVLRLKSQLPREQLEEKAQYVIENDVEKDKLIRRVRAVADALKQMRAEMK